MSDRTQPVGTFFSIGGQTRCGKQWGNCNRPVCATIPSPPMKCDPCAPCREGGHAKLRVVNGIVNSPKSGLDIYVQNMKTYKELQYKDTTEYSWVDAGTVAIHVRVANEVNTLLWPNFVLGENEPYTLLLAGDMKDGQEGSPFMPRAILIRDHNIQVAPGYSHVRFIHASPKSPNVDVVVGAQTVFENVAYGETDRRERHAYQGFPILNLATRTPYEHSISIVQHDEQSSLPSSQTTPIVFVPPTKINLLSDHIYTIFAFGVYGNAESPLQLVVTNDWPEEKYDPTKDEDYNNMFLSDREREERAALYSEVQVSDDGVFTNKQNQLADGENGFALAGGSAVGAVPIGTQIGFPARNDLSCKSENTFNHSSIVRMIHCMGKIGASLSIDGEDAVSNLPDSRISEQLKINPGKRKLRIYAGKKLVGEKEVNFDKGAIYTIVIRNRRGGEEEPEINIHKDVPDQSLSHLKVINLSKTHGKGDHKKKIHKMNQSYQSPGSYPFEVYKPHPTEKDQVLPLMERRQIYVPKNSHVTVFLLDKNDLKNKDNNKLYAVSDTYNWQEK